jgi:hypothetical protein
MKLELLNRRLNRHSRLIRLVCFLGIDYQPAFASFSETKKPVHFLNTELLDSGLQVTYTGELKAHVSDTTDIGTQGLFTLGGLPNLNLKHKMFEFDNGSTTFNAFLLPIGIGNKEGQFLFNYSFVTGLSLSSGSKLNFGFGSTGLVTNQRVLTGEGSSINLYHFDLGYDLMLNQNWYFNSGIMVFPFIDVNIENELIDLQLSGLNPVPFVFVPGFATLTYSPDLSSFNVEFGIFTFSMSPRLAAYPYLSLYWRIQ